MNKRFLVSYLEQHGCRLMRQGRKHEWWEHSVTRKRSSIPRHVEISKYLAKKICRDLGISAPAGY